MTTNEKIEKPERGFRKWGKLVVLSLALAIIIIDTTILNVSLSTIIRDFNTSIQNIQWVITAYSLVLAALTITGGRMGDFFGRKRMFMIGAVIFAIGSFLCSISTNVPMMIWGEAIIEGIGAALMMPATASILVANFRGKDRAIAFGVWGGIAAAASAIGPILGGWLTTNYSWRWGFRINVFVVALLLLGSFLIPESHDTEEKPSLDFGGVILSAVGLLSLVFGFIEASTYGWWKSKATFIAFKHALAMPFGLSIVPPALLIGAIFLALFILWERIVDRGEGTPLVSLSLFKNKQFMSGVAVTSIMALGQAGLIFSIPVFLQSVRNLDAFHTGLNFLPMSLTALFVAPLSVVLFSKISPKIKIVIGLLANTLGFLVLRHQLSVDTTTLQLAPGFILFGLGIGAAMAATSNLTLSAVSPQEAGEASGLNNTMRQVGSTLGSSIIGAILLTALSTNLATGIDKSTVIPTPLKPQITQAVSSQTSNVEFGGGAQFSGRLPKAITNEIVSISHQATVDADKRALSYGAVFAALGALVGIIFLPNSTNVEQEVSAAKHKKA